MGKKKKRQAQNKKPQQVNLELQGIDFGFRPRPLFVSDSDLALNQALRDANIVACAYGYDRVAGYPAPVRCLSLVGTNPDRLKEAFEIMASWGSQTDGDCVAMAVLLLKSGGYKLAIGAAHDRIPQRWNASSLVDPVFFNVSWIKPFDTAHETIKEWRTTIQPPLSPVMIYGASVVVRDGIPKPSEIRQIPGLKGFTKLRLEIMHEEDHPDHWLQRIKRTNGKPNRPEKNLTPKDVLRNRRLVIEEAFPLSRQRILRTEVVPTIISKHAAQAPTEDQIIQAAVNVAISKEMNAGSAHFPHLDDLRSKWWSYVEQRTESATSHNPFPEMDIEQIEKQLMLDTDYALMMHGASTSSLSAQGKFKLLSRLGYTHE